MRAYDLSQPLNNHFGCCFHFFFFSLFGIQEEISGWREDLFTARKSAINLLGVISVSKVGTGLKSELYICPQNYHLGCSVMPAGASNGNT